MTRHYIEIQTGEHDPFDESPGQIFSYPAEWSLDQFWFAMGAAAKTYGVTHGRGSVSWGDIWSGAADLPADVEELRLPRPNLTVYIDFDHPLWEDPRE